jgi:hypothetical protein
LILAFALLFQAQATEVIECAFDGEGEMYRLDAIMPYAHMSGVVDDVGIHGAVMFDDTWIPFASFTFDFDITDMAATIVQAAETETILAGVYFYTSSPLDAGNDAYLTLTVDEQFTRQCVLSVRADVTTIELLIRAQYDELGLDNTAAIITRYDVGTIDGGLAAI